MAKAAKEKSGRACSAPTTNSDVARNGLARLTKICLSLPEATRNTLGAHAGFLVKKKIFAYFLNDHHGDGIVGVTCKVLTGDNVRLVAADPKRFYMPAYIASRGWVGLRLDVGEVDWEEVQDLVTGSYQLMAPKKLAAMAGEASAETARFFTERKAGTDFKAFDKIMRRRGGQPPRAGDEMPPRAR